MHDLPHIALSVRQPSAWAIIAGHKPIENRSMDSIRAGRMTPQRIALHAAAGLKQEEFRYLYWRLEKHGVQCPHPLDLPRGAIIGSVEVTGIITESDSAWFGGQAGLTLANPIPCTPVPSPGKLGYFEWTARGQLAAPTRWMKNWGPPTKTPTQTISSPKPPSPLPLHHANPGANANRQGRRAGAFAQQTDRPRPAIVTC